MKTCQWKYFGLYFIVYVILMTIAGQASADLKSENTVIEKRAAEIESCLTEGPTTFGAPFSDRKTWAPILAMSVGKSYITEAEKYLKRPINDLPEELYKKFFVTGNRDMYQNAYGQWQRRLNILVLAELFENKKRFIPAIEEMIRRFCDYPSWILPAHDRGAEVYDGKTCYSDLVSTNIGCTMGLLYNWLGESLSPEVRLLMKENVNRRVLEPYIKSVKKDINLQWWVRCTNNWNSVCHAGTLGAALSLCESKKERAWYIAAAEYYTRNYFFKGFTSDGYCSEGMSYWNYGYGHFIYLGALVNAATDNKVNFFSMPLTKACTLFGPNMEIIGGRFAAFADCPINASPSSFYVAYMSRVLDLHLSEYEERGAFKHIGLTDFMAMAFLCFDPKYTVPSESKVLGDTKIELPLRTDFADAGILICRPKPNHQGPVLAVTMKGGNNYENHNHNDIGSFTLIRYIVLKSGKVKAEPLILDPGGEVYTQRTFSKNRYVGELLNSFGHSVPRINGSLQIDGRTAKAEVLKKEFSINHDTMTINYTAAYGLKEVDSLYRKFDYYREVPSEFKDVLPNIKEENGAFAIKDTITFAPGKKGNMESALITTENQIECNETKDGSWVVAIGGKEGVRALVSAVDGDGKSLTLKENRAIVGKDDPSAKTKPNRLGFQTVEKVQNCSIQIVMVP